MFVPNKQYWVRRWDAGTESRSNETLISVSSVQAPPPPWLWSLGMLQWPLRTNERRARDTFSQWKTEMSLTGNMANCYKGESHASLCLPNHVILNFQTLTLTSNAWKCSVRREGRVTKVRICLSSPVSSPQPSPLCCRPRGVITTVVTGHSRPLIGQHSWVCALIGWQSPVTDVTSRAAIIPGPLRSKNRSKVVCCLG